MCQQIVLADTLSPKTPIPVGVPQGSVHGTLWFTLYTTVYSNGGGHQAVKISQKS